MKKINTVITGIALATLLIISTGASADERDSFFCLSEDGVGYWSPMNTGHTGEKIYRPGVWCVYYPPKSVVKTITNDNVKATAPIKKVIKKGGN